MRGTEGTFFSMPRLCHLVALSCVISPCAAFAPSRAAWCVASRRIPNTPAIVCQAGGDQTKGAIGGAVLGGLLGGPFGAIFGANIGGAFGANAAAKRAEGERIAATGLDRAIIAEAQRMAQDLSDAEQSLEIVAGAESSQRSLCTRLEEAEADAYAAAEAALRGGDEAGARRHLEERAGLKAKRVQAETELQAAVGRVATMKQQVAELAERASRIEQTMSRAVAAKSGVDAATLDSATSAELEDPLLAKFKELEGK